MSHNDVQFVADVLDSVPGGIGLTGWLNQTYSTFDSEIIGGAGGHHRLPEMRLPRVIGRAVDADQQLSALLHQLLDRIALVTWRLSPRIEYSSGLRDISSTSSFGT